MERRCHKCKEPISGNEYVLERSSVWHIACQEPEEERWVRFQSPAQDRWVGKPFPKDEESD